MLYKHDNFDHSKKWIILCKKTISLHGCANRGSEFEILVDFLNDFTGAGLGTAFRFAHPFKIFIILNTQNFFTDSWGDKKRPFCNHQGTFERNEPIKNYLSERNTKNSRLSSWLVVYTSSLPVDSSEAFKCYMTFLQIFKTRPRRPMNMKYIPRD